MLRSYIPWNIPIHSRATTIYRLNETFDHGTISSYLTSTTPFPIDTPFPVPACCCRAGGKGAAARRSGLLWVDENYFFVLSSGIHLTIMWVNLTIISYNIPLFSGFQPSTLKGVVNGLVGQSQPETMVFTIKYRGFRFQLSIQVYEVVNCNLHLLYSCTITLG